MPKDKRMRKAGDRTIIKRYKRAVTNYEEVADADPPVPLSALQDRFELVVEMTTNVLDMGFTLVRRGWNSGVPVEGHGFATVSLEAYKEDAPDEPMPYVLNKVYECEDGYVKTEPFARFSTDGGYWMAKLLWEMDLNWDLRMEGEKCA